MDVSITSCHPLPGSRMKPRGFTIMEILIALIIGAILIGLAMPSFMGSIRKGRRSEAMSALTALQQEQERWRSNNQSYSTSLSDLKITSPTRPGSYYTLGVVSASGTGYEAVADGTGSTQKSDAQCAKLGVKVDRGTISYASCASCETSTLAYSASNSCWAR